MNSELINIELARMPYAKTIGVKAELVDGMLQFILPFKQENIGNPLLPALHGGCIGGFMETAAICQLMFEHPAATLPKPIGINVDYLRRGKPVDTYAVAVIEKHGGRVANVQVRAWQDDREKPIATLHSHFMIAQGDD